MDSTTGGDANDEFARWLAETARADQATAPGAQPPAAEPAQQQPVATPPAQPQQPPAAPPAAAQPPQAQPAAPEFFGADELAAPPTRPYEPQSGGPPVARTSYQPPAAPVQPTAPVPDYVTPTVLPAAQPEQPPADPPAGQPSWAPGYTAPAAQEQTAPAAAPFFPAEQAAPAAPPSFESAPPPTAAPYTPPVTEAQAPSFPAPAAQDVPTVAYQPQMPAPSFQPPAYEPPPTASSFPAVAQQPAPSMPAADPFGSLFTDTPDDTAARLAASPPPSSDAPLPSYDTPLVSPPAESVPSDEDPMKSLFGLETVEQPAIAVEPELPTYTPEPAYAPPAAPEPAFAAPPTYEPAQPVAPAYTPEPAYAAEPALASVGASPGAAAGGGYSLSQPEPADDDPTAGTQFFGGGAGDFEEPPNLDATTTAEKIGLGLAILLPPIGLIASIVNAVQSSRERGWVHRLVRISLVVAVIMTVVAGFAGAALYKVIDDGRKHDQIAAASKQFCATVAADPSMVAPPSFGFPAPGATIPDTITSFQAYVDKWTALGKVSPSGIRTDVNRVADAAQTILDDVTNSRLVDDEANQANMSAVAGSTQIVGWDQDYCS